MLQETEIAVPRTFRPPSSSCFRTVFIYDFRYNARRAFYWIWFLLMLWNAWLMSMGIWFIRSIDTAVGTEKSFVNSEFQIAFVFALMPGLMLGLFFAIATGTPLIRDAQQKVNDILNTTRLRPSEYIWGKFLAAMASSFGVLALFLAVLILLNEVIPNPIAAEIHGPFHARSYFMPAMVFILPMMFFVSGICFAIGEFTRKAFLVYLFPVVLLLTIMELVIVWFPADASPAFTRFMQFVDPTGFRWLKQTWLIVDRGVAFYNTHNIEYDAGFLASRLAFILFGLLLVEVSHRHYARKHVRIPDHRLNPQSVATPVPVALPVAMPLPEMSRSETSLLKQTMHVLRLETKEMTSQPWLLAFVAMIAIILIAPDRGGQGPLHLINIYTAGNVASSQMFPLTIMICFLILFTNAESLYRETQTGIGPIIYSTPLPTFALLAGKGIANFFLAIFTMLVAFLAAALLIISNKESPLDFHPFIQIWLYLMVPTFIFWTAFVMAAFALTKSRMSTYGIALALLFATGWAAFNNKLNWVTNWPLINTITWSDFGAFDIDRDAYLWNRLLYLVIAISLFAFALYQFPRRVLDDNQKGRDQSRPYRRLIVAGKLALFVGLPILIGFFLWLKIENGFQGNAEENREKDYWRKNIATFVNEPLPYRTRIDMNIRLFPSTRSFQVAGSYDMINRLEKPLYRIPLTGVGHWKNLKWSVNGKAFQPENRSGMFVFDLEPPLQTQQKITIGFTYEGIMLPGITRNGGYLGLGEFILPSGVALTGRNPWFVPVLGYVDTVGVDDENRYEPRDPGPHFYEGITDSGVDRSLLDTRIQLDVPEDYFATSMGVLKNEKISQGRRILLWESDYPLRVFNVVAGKWVSKKGKSSVVYYNPRHYYNIDTMLLGLDSARKYYSQWFGPYVWKELRMNEFPAYATYARGNPTNIFFSEAIGFLTKSVDQPAVFGLSAFGVTAHESAHQWWGHMLAPGEGPGGVVLAEGMANFATLCLVEQVEGEKIRQSMAKQIEAFYGENRAVSSERPLAKTVWFRPGDETVIYDKGSWVFWMMKNLLGRDQMFAGLTSFIKKWHLGPDHPVMEDFVADMRPYASDQQVYDAFVRQWIFEVKMPEYRYIEKPQKNQNGKSWIVNAVIKNVGNASMPVDVAVTNGNRYEKNEEYRESRIQIQLAPEEQRSVTIHCDFDPSRIVVDPDIQVFQLQRNAATFRFN
jgi:ABC-2 type transport system permease protein